MNRGWISIHRRIQDHWLWNEKPFSRGQAWIDLLMMASHRNKKFLLGNTLIDIKRGSFVTSQAKLMKRWGWGAEKTRTFLKLLGSENMIDFLPDKRKTTIAIVNYDDYQIQNDLNLENSTGSKEVQNDNRMITECQQNDNRMPAETINNDNNVNNDNKYNVIVLTQMEEQFIKILGGIENYPLDRKKDLDMYNKLKERYPELNLIESIKDWATYKLDKPLKPKDNPRSQINTSCKNHIKWGKNLKGDARNEKHSGSDGREHDPYAAVPNIEL